MGAPFKILHDEEADLSHISVIKAKNFVHINGRNLNPAV